MNSDKVFKINQEWSKNAIVSKKGYENLFENLEATARPLLKFLELPWHDSVLEFYKTAKKGPQIKTPSYDQVIKPIYSEASVRWKMYKEQTTNIYPILEPWIKKFNY